MLKKICVYLFLSVQICVLSFLLPALLSAQADSVFSAADLVQAPLFEGCDDALISLRQQKKCSQEKLSAFIAQNLQYPDSAKAKGTEGLVVVRLIINAEGYVQQSELLHDAGDFCGREALRLSRMLPRFVPARHADGSAVACFLLLPIRFSLGLESVSPYDDQYRLHWGNIYTDSLHAEQLQKLLTLPPQIRDHYGNTYPILRIEISLIRGSQIHTEIARSEIPNKEMRRRFARPSVGSTLVLKVEAENAEKGERIPLLREYQILPAPPKGKKKAKP